MNSIFIGYDQREQDAFHVARSSLLRHLSVHIPVRSLVLQQLQADGFYVRPTERVAGRLVDVLSRRPGYGGYMSTEFALSRFLAPFLARTGWVAFTDCDVLVRKDFAELFRLCEPSKALMCVKHQHQPSEDLKMDGQVQTAYARKNWSSVMVFNCDHPAMQRLTLQYFNTAPGIDLHQLRWLEDDEIGALPPEWNYLVGEDEPMANPALVHFTNGIPSMKGYENQPFADEWRSELRRRAA